MSATPAPLRSDPAATARRTERLAAYFAATLLDGATMICADRVACRRSALFTTSGAARADVSFAEAQLPHVGPHYDLADERGPVRILIVGMETGEPEEHVTMRRRREQILVSAALPMTRRNPHMQGVTHALRLALGRSPGTDRPGELLDLGPDRVHVFDACATTNVRLCSAHASGRRSRGTPAMTSNCLRHLASTIEILEPTLVVAQGEVGRALWPIVDRREDAGAHLSRIVVRGVSTVLARFSHPSAWGALNWGRPDTPYLRGTVVPVLAAARAVR